MSTSTESPILSGPASDSGPGTPIKIPLSLEGLQIRVENEGNELRSRIQSLENDRERFLKALRGAVGMLLENPMASAMMPKEMKRDLRVYLEQNSDGPTA